MKTSNTILAHVVSAAVLATALAACTGQSTEDRAREAAADIRASIQDFDVPALNQKVEKAMIVEVQTQLTSLKDYMGEVSGEMDQVLVNAIQAFQRRQNEAIPWYLFWTRTPNDGLIDDELRADLARAAS